MHKRRITERRKRLLTKKQMLKYIKLAIEYNDMEWFTNYSTIYWTKRFNIDISNYQ